MNIAIKISLLASGVFLLAGLLTGVVKYRKIMSSPNHRAPVYIDIAHRASLLYSFASLVMAKLLEYSPYSPGVQLVAVGFPLLFFAVTIGGYSGKQIDIGDALRTHVGERLASGVGKYFDHPLDANVGFARDGDVFRLALADE